MDLRGLLEEKTKQPWFLVALAAVILGLGGVAGFLAPLLPAGDPGDAVDRVSQVASHGKVAEVEALCRQLVERADVPPTELMRAMPNLFFADSAAFDRDGFQGLLEASGRPPEEVEALRRLFLSLESGELVDVLRAERASPKPAPLARFSEGVFRGAQGSTAEGFPGLVAECELHPTDEARRSLVAWCSARGADPQLRYLYGLKEFFPLIPTSQIAKWAASEGDWGVVWRLTPAVLAERWRPGPALLALVTGGCWALFLARAGNITSPMGARWWLCLVALLVGVGSALLNQFAAAWQEQAWGLAPSADPLMALRNSLGGVGLREENLKLLLLLPLLPVLIKRKSNAEALIVGASMGLGLSLHDCVDCFAPGRGLTGVSRAVTASFLQLAITGLVALAVVRGVAQPRARLARAAAIVGLAVLLHGLYDFAIDLASPILAVALATPIYLAVGYQFFHELHAVWWRRPATISISAVLVGSVSLLLAMAFAYLSWRVGSSGAAELLLPGAVANTLLAALFVKQMHVSGPKRQVRPLAQQTTAWG